MQYGVVTKRAILNLLGSPQASAVQVRNVMYIGLIISCILWPEAIDAFQIRQIEFWHVFLLSFDQSVCLRHAINNVF